MGNETFTVFSPIFSLLLKFYDVSADELVSESKADVGGLGDVTLERAVKIAELGDQLFEVHAEK